MEILYKPIEIYDYSDRESFLEYVQEHRTPLLVRGLDVGGCTTKWTVQYLSESIKQVPITVHVSPSPRMSFLEKNFTYVKMPFDEFLQRASKEVKTYKPILCENEVLYYRSISFDRKTKECSDLTKHFPTIAGDFKIPDVFRPEDFFSSVFRISSPNMQVWIHYDVMDNILVQVHGTKKVTLFDPDDAKYLYMVGDKSEVLDVSNPNLHRHPLFLNAIQHECTLNPGDAVFIPALWLHSTNCETFSISVNVFWKNLSHELYDKRDVYGNKDLIPASKALSHIKKAYESLNPLPHDYKRFYIQRCITDLKRLLEEESSKPEKPGTATNQPLNDLTESIESTSIGSKKNSEENIRLSEDRNSENEETS